MGDRAARTALFDEFARCGQGLASGRRIELVDVLANGERTVEALAGEVGLSVANTSQHLQICARPAWLAAEGRAPRSITGWPGRIFELWRTLRTWPPAGWPRSNGWPSPTSAGAMTWSR